MFNANKIINNYVYVHNLSFDGVFILEMLTLNKETYIFKSFIHNSEIYSINIKKKNKKCEIIFKCSYKILPLSLKKIAIGFNLNEKTIFPYNFISKETLFYIGKIPEAKFFNNNDEYHIFKNMKKEINVKKETIEYCFNDVKITSEFLKILFKLVIAQKIQLKNIYSAPSLSLKIFSQNFNNNKLSFNLSKLSKIFIRPAYFGGRCEVYGNPDKNEKIYHFDFSGMYSQCMRQKYCFGKNKIIDNNINIEKPGFY
jgi:hypothetical protein